MTDLPINNEVVLENIRGNAMELIAHINPTNSKMIELEVLRSPKEEEHTRVLFHPLAGYRLREGVRRRDIKPRTFRHGTLTIDTARSSTHPKALARPPEVAPVLLGEDKRVKLRIFVKMKRISNIKRPLPPKEKD
jgi:hypothetical protein